MRKTLFVSKMRPRSQAAARALPERLRFIGGRLLGGEDRKLMLLIDAQPDIMFQVKDDEGWFGTHFPQGVDELRFRAYGVIKDVDRLRNLFDLFAETLTRLCDLGAASDAPPGVKL